MVSFDSINQMPELSGFAEKKVDNGKLIKAKVRFENTILQVQLFGDFFLHPEDTILALESCLIGKPVEKLDEQIQKLLEITLRKKNAQLIGATSADIAQVITKAIQNAHEENRKPKITPKTAPEGTEVSDSFEE